MPENEYIIGENETVLVTGANGFVGSRVVRALLSLGFKRVRCLMRPTGNPAGLEEAREGYDNSLVEVVKGNLLSREICEKAAEGVSVVYHLAAGVEKTYPGCFLNSVVTTRNLLDSVKKTEGFKRFVNVSSLAVYSNAGIKRGGLLDESCKVDDDIVARHDPYAYGKLKQDELVLEYAQNGDLPYVIVRPGVVFGPAKTRIPGRVGIDTFGFFMHLGMGNRMPLTYVDNCAEAIVLSGLRKGVEGEVINILDDDLPTSRQFLSMYKKHVRRFRSVPVPYPFFFLFSYFWEKYSRWSEGQLPPAFNRKMCATYFKGNTYSNGKAKKLLGWYPKIEMSEGLENYFSSARGER